MRADDEVLIAHGLERPVAVPSHDYENDPPYVAVAREYRLTVGRGWLTGWTYDCYQHNARRLDAPECGLQLIANA
jgi:hypothetical protein